MMSVSLFICIVFWPF